MARKLKYPDADHGPAWELCVQNSGWTDASCVRNSSMSELPQQIWIEQLYMILKKGLRNREKLRSQASEDNKERISMQGGEHSEIHRSNSERSYQQC
jgi:hypothetical protein